MVEAQDVKTIVVLNQGARSFTTSVGILEIGKSLELPEKEALNLLDYHGIIDASKLVKTASNVDAVAEVGHLKNENAHLKAENSKLKSTVEKLEADIAELEEKLAMPEKPAKSGKPEKTKGKK
jgi:cell division protein FtsB